VTANDPRWLLQMGGPTWPHRLGRFSAVDLRTRKTVWIAAIHSSSETTRWLDDVNCCVVGPTVVRETMGTRPPV